MSDKKIITYPVSIMKSRYGGAYEGGAWGAFHLYPEDIPEAAMGDDISCSCWWDHFGEGVGVGGTPDEAFARLVDNTHPLTMVFDHKIQQRVLMRVEWGVYAINREQA